MARQHAARARVLTVLDVEVFFSIVSENLIFVVPCIMFNSEIIPTRCNNCVYSSPLRRINAIVASSWNYFTTMFLRV